MVQAISTKKPAPNSNVDCIKVDILSSIHANLFIEGYSDGLYS